MYEMAENLVFRYNYEILHLNEQKEEIWLEKVEKNISYIIRLVHQGFDWKNHLKKDISIVFEKTKGIRKMLQGKNIVIHNVYISPNTPVDSWEVLKKPLIIREKNPIKMNVYYFSDQDIETELERLNQNIEVVLEEPNDVTAEQMDEEINRYKIMLYHRLQAKQKKEQSIFTYGKPIITYLLIVLNAILFLMLELNGGSENHSTLIEFGAKHNPLIIDGEWWRIITSMFLHIGLLHFASNMLFLYYFGSLAERIYGSVRFLLIYLFAGIGGGITSFIFVTNLSAGASGALYGLFGAFIYFGLFHRRIFFQTIGQNIIFLLGLNIVLGFVLPQLDVAAHLGGLVAGFLAAGIVHFPKKKHLLVQGLSLLIYLSLMVAVLPYGIEHNEQDATYQLMNIDILLQEERYEEVVEGATKGLENTEELAGLLLFQRSYAYIQLNELEKAIQDLEQCIQVIKDPKELPEAYYNLALLYQETGDKRAEDLIRQAYQAKPSDERIAELYEVITGEKRD